MSTNIIESSFPIETNLKILLHSLSMGNMECHPQLLEEGICTTISKVWTLSPSFQKHNVISRIFSMMMRILFFPTPSMKIIAGLKIKVMKAEILFPTSWERSKEIFLAGSVSELQAYLTEITTTTTLGIVLEKMIVLITEGVGTGSDAICWIMGICRMHNTNKINNSNSKNSNKSKFLRSR